MSLLMATEDLILLNISYFIYLIDISVNDITLTANSSATDSGTNLAFICEAFGRPAPVIQWYKDGQIVVNNDQDNIIILNMPLSQVQVRSVLILSPLQNNDGGSYWCSATIPPNVIESNNITIGKLIAL